MGCVEFCLTFDLQSERLHKVLELVSTVHDLCAVLGIDFYTTVTEVHPSLNDATDVQSKSISNDTLARLAKTVVSLKEDKKQRLQKVVTFMSFKITLEYNSLWCVYIFYRNHVQMLKHV